MENQNCKKFTKTKILATIGPATQTYDAIKNLILGGVDGFRFNFSHAKPEVLTDVVKFIRSLSKKYSIPVSILGDLQGPKIRIGELQDGGFELEKGDIIKITSKNIIGTKSLISTSLKNLSREAKIGDMILIDDGLIRLIVKKIEKDIVICEVFDGGFLKSKKGMNLPGVKISTPSLTEKDRENLIFAINNKLDFIALSFVRNKKDVIELRNLMGKYNANIPIISKIELAEGVRNFEEILEVSDGIMVARGDLGVEMEPQEVPLIQKRIIKRCNEERKLVITATQMLESMVNNPLPTRAEASDVANAVFDGTDVVMLSAETSVGKYPLRAVETMNKILCRAEEGMETISDVSFVIDKEDQKIIHAVAKAVTFMADQIKAKAIIPITHTGYTAIILSKYKPHSKILAITESAETTQKLNLYRGVRAFASPDIRNLEETITFARKIFIKEKELNKGDNVIFVGSLSTKNKGVQNLIKVVII